MFYDDYDLDYNSSYDYSYDLDEMCEYHNASYNMQDTYDLDDEYERDTQDYDALAYRHYAWYNEHISHLDTCSCTQSATYASL